MVRKRGMKVSKLGFCGAEGKVESQKLGKISCGLISARAEEIGDGGMTSVAETT